MILPSKELFEKVTSIKLGIQTSWNDQFEEYIWLGEGEYSNLIYYGVKGLKSKTINIYEFEHKCKEWALDNGLLEYKILSYSDDKRFISVEYILHKNQIIPDYGIYRTDILESFINLCQLIIDKKER